MGREELGQGSEGERRVKKETEKRMKGKKRKKGWSKRQWWGVLRVQVLKAGPRIPMFSMSSMDPAYLLPLADSLAAPTERTGLVALAVASWLNSSVLLADSVTCPLSCISFQVLPGAVALPLHIHLSPPPFFHAQVFCPGTSDPVDNYPLAST